jgi:hypothetical protein
MSRKAAVRPDRMKPLGSLRLAVLLAVAGASLAGQPATRAAEGEEITAVSSVASEGYVRTKLPDGTFRPETYAFGEGGHMGGPMRDDTVDSLKFMSIARTVAGPLASQKYLPSKDPKQTGLLIMVYWGTTTGTSGASNSAEYQNLQASQTSSLPQPTPPPPTSAAMMASSAGSKTSAQESAIMDQVAKQNFNSALATVAMEDKQRGQADSQNAMLLGYDTELATTEGQEKTALRHKREDLIAEIEDNRYFVVLMAYDFQAVWKEKKHKLLWVTRISIRQQGNDFGKALPAMTQYASQYFGVDTNGLIRKPLPEGHVDIGETKTIGVVPDK